MATTTTARQNSQKPPIFNLSSVKTGGSGLPNRYLLHAREGWGKTSFAAQCPTPVFLQSKGETGLQTLIDAGQLPETSHFPEANTWEEANSYIDALLMQDHQYKTLVTDTLNGLERLCHEHVCQRDFGGDWGDKGFGSFQKGPEIALAEWREMLAKLDRLRSEKRMTIFCLCHTKVVPFRNPMGADYDRYQAEMDKRTWALTAKWADVVLFGNFDTSVSAVRENKKTGEQKGKAFGGKTRILYTVNDAAYDAKNRLGLPEEIEMGDSPQEAWANFMAAVKAGRSKNA